MSLYVLSDVFHHKIDRGREHDCDESGERVPHAVVSLTQPSVPHPTGLNWLDCFQLTYQPRGGVGLLSEPGQNPSHLDPAPIVQLPVVL